MEASKYNVSNASLLNLMSTEEVPYLRLPVLEKVLYISSVKGLFNSANSDTSAIRYTAFSCYCRVGVFVNLKIMKK
jgi:hypothetical protein